MSKTERLIMVMGVGIFLALALAFLTHVTFVETRLAVPAPQQSGMNP
jgi:hypothetical protein